MLSVVPARDVVLDDVIDLTLGDQVSVDGTVLSSAGLEIDESLLTGESRPVKKKQGDSVAGGHERRRGCWPHGGHGCR